MSSVAVMLTSNTSVICVSLIVPDLSNSGRRSSDPLELLLLSSLLDDAASVFDEPEPSDDAPPFEHATNTNVSIAIITTAKIALNFFTLTTPFSNLLHYIMLFNN